MTYPSVDGLQKALCQSVFHYAKDAKKAAGRALGTLVEIITFYVLKSWDLDKYVAIERPLPEYRNADITHNVEYSLHPSRAAATLRFDLSDLPLTPRKVLRKFGASLTGDGAGVVKGGALLSADLVLRNSCTVSESEDSFLIARLLECSAKHVTVSLHTLLKKPFAIVECKRVGVEEGTRKGPQTIEKAKQGAYVARTVSCLQRIRLTDGGMGGIVQRPDGTMLCKPYNVLLEEILKSDDMTLLRDFVMTVGVVSNHGNWFTSDNHNKELKVLAQSYDWLLFLTDAGLADFIDTFILHPGKTHEPIRKAFLASYTGEKGVNQFTKVQMNLQADLLLRRYFCRKAGHVLSWFNVITPGNKTLQTLLSELQILAAKDWNGTRA